MQTAAVVARALAWIALVVGVAALPPRQGAAADIAAPEAAAPDRPFGDATASDESFSTWLAGVRVEAMRRGVSAATLDAALSGVRASRPGA